MDTTFSRMLIQLRKDAGFPTAYKFYHTNGGAAVLKMSYRNYLMIEQGKKLPMFDKLGTFISVLRMIAKTAEANALVSAWLRTMAGEENYRELIEPLLASGGEIRGHTPMQKAMKKAITAKRYHLTLPQIEAIYARPENHLCYIAATNDSGAWSVKEFAARLGMKEADAGRSLKALAAEKIVKEIKKGVYKCPLAEKLLDYPLRSTFSPELRKRILDSYTRLEATGKEELLSQSIVRADELEFKNFLPVADDNITTAATYAITEKTPHSALFMVQGKITKLRDF